jgi:hypothetical protein
LVGGCRWRRHLVHRPLHPPPSDHVCNAENGRPTDRGADCRVQGGEAHASVVVLHVCPEQLACLFSKEGVSSPGFGPSGRRLSARRPPDVRQTSAVCRVSGRPSAGSTFEILGLTYHGWHGRDQHVTGSSNPVSDWGKSKRLGSWKGKTVVNLPWLPSAYTAVPIRGVPSFHSLH